MFDIHSPRVPSAEEMTERIKQMSQFIDPNLLWVNPDCGLKTRTWPECTAQLQAMVQAAQNARKLFA